MSDERLRLAFAGAHPQRIRGLLEERSPKGALRALLAATESDRVKQALAVDAATRRAELEALSIAVAMRGTGGYPEHLALRPDAPDVLFVRGTLPVTAGVAVVGTRRCTAYGRRLAEAYGRAIAGAGWPLVSGLARGIDGAAHRGTVGAGGVGVAVLGCGLDIDYPREHRKLADALVELGGAVVSEYPPGTPPDGWRFPPRNRIISGMTGAVVVVEANVVGGALITANAALEQGVAVFAVPGDVGRESSQGCNLLIRDGAHPVLDPVDLVAELELVMGPVPKERSQRAQAELVPVGGVTLDALSTRLDVPPAALLATVSRWEAEGLVERAGELVFPVSSTGDR